MLFVDFITLFFMCVTKKFKPFQINGNYPFSQQYMHTQVNKYFNLDDVSFFEYLNSLNLDENTYILSLRSKLIKSHIFIFNFLKNKKMYLI